MTTNRSRYLDVLTAVLVLCALVVTGLFVRREFFPPKRGPVSYAPRAVADWQRFAAAGQAMGPAGAAVTIVEFSDFQCPFCKSMQPALKAVLRRYPRDVRVVYRHFPIEQAHPHAVAAAEASECAARQGRFQPFHDALYDRQEAIGTEAWSTFARGAGVADLAAFDRCVRDRETSARVREDIAAGNAMGVQGTPTLLVNGQAVLGGDEAQVERMVREALSASGRLAEAP